MNAPSAIPRCRASDPGASVFVTANAGSGKTSTLVERVARLLLRRREPEAILCVTYTKAAAAEMQRRLFDELGAWAVMDDAPLTEALAELDEAGRRPVPGPRPVRPRPGDARRPEDPDHPRLLRKAAAALSAGGRRLARLHGAGGRGRGRGLGNRPATSWPTAPWPTPDEPMWPGLRPFLGRAGLARLQRHVRRLRGATGGDRRLCRARARRLEAAMARMSGAAAASTTPTPSRRRSRPRPWPRSDWARLAARRRGPGAGHRRDRPGPGGPDAGGSAETRRSPRSGRSSRPAAGEPAQAAGHQVGGRRAPAHWLADEQARHLDDAASAAQGRRASPRTPSTP